MNYEGRIEPRLTGHTHAAQHKNWLLEKGIHFYNSICDSLTMSLVNNLHSRISHIIVPKVFDEKKKLFMRLKNE